MPAEVRAGLNPQRKGLGKPDEILAPRITLEVVRNGDHRVRVLVREHGQLLFVFSFFGFLKRCLVFTRRLVCWAIGIVFGILDFGETRPEGAIDGLAQERAVGRETLYHHERVREQKNGHRRIGRYIVQQQERMLARYQMVRKPNVGRVDQQDGRRHRETRESLVRVCAGRFARRRARRRLSRFRRSVDVYEARDLLRPIALVENLEVGRLQPGDRISVRVVRDHVHRNQSRLHAQRVGGRGRRSRRSGLRDGSRRKHRPRRKNQHRKRKCLRYTHSMPTQSRCRSTQLRGHFIRSRSERKERIRRAATREKKRPPGKRGGRYDGKIDDRRGTSRRIPPARLASKHCIKTGIQDAPGGRFNGP